MNYQFGYDNETLSFQPVTVRSRLILGGEPVKLSPQTGAAVVGGSGYEGKILVGDSELMAGGKAHRFQVGLNKAFTLQEYRNLIMGKKPVPIQVTLYPDLALPLPTAGVPIVASAPPIADTVQVTIPEAALARLEAEPDGAYDPETGDVFVKARVHLPDVIANRAELERQFTHQCRFAPRTERLALVGTRPDGEWARAHLRLQRAESGHLRQPEKVPVLVTTDIDGVRLEAEVRISVSPARELVLELSTSRVRTTLNRPALLTVRAMDRLDGGTLVPADDADITVTEPKGLEDVVTVVPSSGRGALTTEIRQVGISNVDSGALVVEASVPTGGAEARVEVWPATGPYVLTWERLESPEVPLAGPPPPWRVVWHPEEGAWRCEPLLLKLMHAVDGRIEAQPIGRVEVRDSQGWLEVQGQPEPYGEGTLVRVRANPNAIRPEIGPGLGPPTIRAVDAVPEKDERPEPIYTVATVSVSREGDEELVATTDVACVAVPPQIAWRVRQAQVLRMSGGHEAIDLTIDGDLPTPWQYGIELLVALEEPEAAERRGIALGQASARSSLLDQDLAGDSDLGWVSGTIGITSERLCFRKVDTIPEDPEPETLDLAVVVRSPYLGVTHRQTIPVKVQPQLVALYLGAHPWEAYPWEIARNKIQVIRDDQAGATSWSKLPLTLKHIAADGWPDPPVRWSFAYAGEPDGTADPLGDRLTPSAGTASEYVAPRRAMWEERGKPVDRAIQCKIGPGENTEYVDEADRGLYLSGAITAVLQLAEALPKIKLNLGVKPAGLPDAAEALALRDESIYDALNREFVIEVDLQRLPLDRRET
jgi:hypothetical protein